MNKLFVLKSVATTVIACGLLTATYAAQAADALSGTWTGTLSSERENFSSTLNFSERGYWVYTYTNEDGVTRSVELEKQGQTIGYVPSSLSDMKSA